MAVYVDPKKKIPIFLDSDLELPEAERTTFFIRPFTERDMQEFDGDMANGELVKRFLTGWKNFRNEDGDVIDFDVELVDDFPPEDCEDLVRKIVENTALKKIVERVTRIAEGASSEAADANEEEADSPKNSE